MVVEDPSESVAVPCFCYDRRKPFLTHNHAIAERFLLKMEKWLTTAKYKIAEIDIPEDNNGNS